MSDAMSNAEIHQQDVELLPARTVLSLLQTDVTGNNGDAGTAGAKGASMSRFSMLGMLGWGGTGFLPNDGPAGSSTDGRSG